jgi:hypothetical protein
MAGYGGATSSLSVLVLTVRVHHRIGDGSSSFCPEAAVDQWLTRPVDNRTFQTFLDFFAYDKQFPFELRVLTVEEQEGIRKEHLSFQSTPGVRVFANLYRSPGASVRWNGCIAN